MAPAFAPLGVLTTLDESRRPSCQKLLFSATLTSDPGRLRALDLYEPRYFVFRGSRVYGEGSQEESTRAVLDAALEGVVMEQFTMPETLLVRCLHPLLNVKQPDLIIYVSPCRNT
jgi:ATP-dependent RNA helicase DDX51/DBP6